MVNLCLTHSMIDEQLSPIARKVLTNLYNSQYPELPGQAYDPNVDANFSFTPPNHTFVGYPGPKHSTAVVVQAGDKVGFRHISAKTQPHLFPEGLGYFSNPSHDYKNKTSIHNMDIDALDAIRATAFNPEYRDLNVNVPLDQSIIEFGIIIQNVFKQIDSILFVFSCALGGFSFILLLLIHNINDGYPGLSTALSTLEPIFSRAFLLFACGGFLSCINKITQDYILNSHRRDEVFNELQQNSSLLLNVNLVDEVNRRIPSIYSYAGTWVNTILLLTYATGVIIIMLGTPVDSILYHWGNMGSTFYYSGGYQSQKKLWKVTIYIRIVIGLLTAALNVFSALFIMTKIQPIQELQKIITHALWSPAEKKKDEAIFNLTHPSEISTVDTFKPQSRRDSHRSIFDTQPHLGQDTIPAPIIDSTTKSHQMTLATSPMSIIKIQPRAFLTGTQIGSKPAKNQSNALIIPLPHSDESTITNKADRLIHGYFQDKQGISQNSDFTPPSYNGLHSLQMNSFERKGGDVFGDEHRALKWLTEQNEGGQLYKDVANNSRNQTRLDWISTKNHT